MNPSPPIHPLAGGLAALPPQWPAGGAAIPTAELQGLRGIGPLEAGGIPATPTPGCTGESFSRVLGNLVGEVNAKQAASGEAVNGLLSGQNVSLHQAMIAMEEANLSFQLMVEVRNKLLESYQELMRMQI